MTYASVVSGTARTSMAVFATSVAVASSEDTAAGSPWTPILGPNSGKLSKRDDTADPGIKQGVVVSNYYQMLVKDDTPGEEESMFISISNNEIKNIEENLNEGENKKKNKKNKNKKEPKEKESTVLRKYEQDNEGKQAKDSPDPPAGHFDNAYVTNDTGNNIAAGNNSPFLSTLKAYDHSVSSYPNPSSGFSPDNPDSTQENNHDNYQHHHGHDHKTDTDIKTNASLYHGRHYVGYNQGHYQKHPHLHEHQNPNMSTQVRESLHGLEEATTAVLTSTLLHNNDHNSIMDSRTTTATSSGSGDGVSGGVEVDIGTLPIRKRRLNSVGEDCDVLLGGCGGGQNKNSSERN